MQTDKLSDLIQSELKKVAEPSRRASLEALLTSPRQMTLNWAYGQEGEHFDCWRVGQSPNGNTWLVFCEQGFGPAYPWGFISAEDEWIGMDSQWHLSLEDAAICAGLLNAPAGYEVP
jgi:hypothetical protein